MDKIDKQIAETKTLCCKADWYRKSRANFRCKKCEKDVTLEIMFLYKALTE
jgi:tRNA(Ile2) C34 agmatinyltransferase TiaS